MFASTEHELLQQFLEDFKHVFGEDWGYTQAVIKDRSFAPLMISPRGTFLNPAAGDGSHHWASHGGLLGWYRELDDPDVSGDVEKTDGATIMAVSCGTSCDRSSMRQ